MSGAIVKSPNVRVEEITLRVWGKWVRERIPEGGIKKKGRIIPRVSSFRLRSRTILLAWEMNYEGLENRMARGCMLFGESRGSVSARYERQSLYYYVT